MRRVGTGLLCAGILSGLVNLQAEDGAGTRAGGKPNESSAGDNSLAAGHVTEVFPLRYGKAEELVSALAAVTDQLKVRLTIDEKTRSILANGPAGRMGGLRRLIEQLDLAAGHPEAYFFVSVVGAVNNQGTIQLNAEDKPIIWDAIARAGGLGPRADHNTVRLVRQQSDGTRTQTVLPEAQLMKGTGPELLLKAGDVIIVSELPAPPAEGAVYITGAVNSPGRFSIRDGKIAMTELIAHAGGLTRVANGRKVHVTRSDSKSGKSRVLTVDVAALLEGRKKEGAVVEGEFLENGDLVYVSESAF